MNKGKKWEQDEEKFLIEFYPKNGVKFCTNHLNRTERSIVERCKKLKLKMLPEFKSILYQKYTKEFLEIAVKQSLCYADVLRNIGLIPQAGNFKQLKRNLIKFNIDVSHFLTPGQLTQLRYKNGTQLSVNKEKDINEYLIIGSTISSDVLKKKLYKCELKRPVCEICTQDDNWFGKKLIMILDHENGEHFDNRLENLRILCPNCNSTLDTNCSKNRKITNKKIDNIIIIEKKNIKINALKPTKEELTELIKTINWTQLGKMFGVSDNGVRNWAKKYELIK
jgi:predicted Zn-dependent protease with MMP-like domain